MTDLITALGWYAYTIPFGWIVFIVLSYYGLKHGKLDPYAGHPAIVLAQSIANGLIWPLMLAVIVGVAWHMRNRCSQCGGPLGH